MVQEMIKKPAERNRKKDQKVRMVRKEQNNSEHRGRVEGKNKKKSIRNVHSKKNRK